MEIFCDDVAKYIEKIAPINLAMDWDNPGLILGDMGRKIKSVVVCLDVTKDVVDFAIQKGANLILSHHPFIFKGIKKIDTSETKGELIEKIIKNNICVYSAHTNFDYAQNGLNNILAKKIWGFCVISPFLQCTNNKKYGNIQAKNIQRNASLEKREQRQQCIAILWILTSFIGQQAKKICPNCLVKPTKCIVH